MLSGGLAAACLGADTCALINFKKDECRDELVRLTLPPPGPAGSFVVRENGREIPYQVEDMDGRKWIWVCSTFAGGATNVYAVAAGTPAAAAPLVKVTHEKDDCILDNGAIAVRVPFDMGARTGPPLPVLALRLPDGKWIGGGAWKSGAAFTRFAATVTGDGKVFGKVRLRYEFEGQGGVFGDTPAFAEVDVALGSGWKHVEVTERHAMNCGDFWEFELSRGWSPTNGIARNFDGGLGRPLPEAVRPLGPVAHQAFPPDTYLVLLPRWNQNYRDGWAFLASDGKNQAGAVVVRASRWVWPHPNAIRAVVKKSGDYAGLRCPTWCGERLWWLTASPEPADTKYVARYAWEHLDKLNHEMILEWPGKPGKYGGINFYDNVNINPTSMIRGWNRKAVEGAGQPGNYGTLALQQTLMHPDSYGSYWQYWTPNNPNFFSDFYTRAIVLVTNLKDHPRYEELKRQAVLKAREDICHSVTLPGGAGQECPGYMSVSHWTQFAAILKEHLGVDDPVLNERIAAAQSFRRRISQPDGAIRRRLPIGDTHNGPDGPRVEEVPAEEVAQWTTAELPGFGVIFNARPGTGKETYLSFKSGPNRGHYHGDQLAFHYCADARPVAVDHHCSYHPRASQEAMHNRVAFFTDRMPSANMDGFERLIAFKTSADASVAIGQVESDRLRHLDPFPPPKWHPEFPQHPFSQPLVYRRTVVLVKGPDADYFVIRDQFRASEPVHAAFCLHALDPDIVLGGTNGVITSGNELTDATMDFAKLGAQPGWTLALLDVWRDRQTGKGADGSVYFSAPVAGVKPTSLTVNGVLPGAGLIRPDAHAAQAEGKTAGERVRYRLFKPVREVSPGLFAFNSGLRLWCRATEKVQAAMFPWEHNNGGRESTQGLRLEMRNVREGEYVSVLCHGRDLGVEPVEGGVRVGADEVLFAGDTTVAGGDSAVVTVRRGGKAILSVTGRDVDLNRSQGQVGLSVTDSGHPFGALPDWLLRQRAAHPAWYAEWKDHLFP